jgi:carboxypeptidase C (cathepsin A)
MAFAGMRFRRLAGLWAALLILGTNIPAGWAQPSSDAHAAACSPRTSLPPPAAAVPQGNGPRRLPADSVTHQRLDLPGRSLCFTATAGTVVLPTDAANTAPAAEVAYVAFTLEETQKHNRPVTFALNGGPGIASAWLQLGGVGPWRLPMEGDDGAPSSNAPVQDNAETWLDFTDLVFLDPVGTGYSRSALGNDETRHRFWNVDSDIDQLADVIHRWLLQNGRLASPKFILGESYGGFRGPRLARTLRTRFDVGVKGLILMSPVLDFGRFHASFNPLSWVAHLPSMAAAYLEASGKLTREAMAEVEHYALSDYLTDVMRGVNDPAALDRMSKRVAALTGLDPALVRSLDGRIPVGTFQRQLTRKQGRITSLYDASISGFDPDPTNPVGHFADPILDGLAAPLTSAMVEMYSERLGWRLDDSHYELLNLNANRNWEWGREEPEAITDLRAELALDPHLHVLIMHGFTDLVTPYLETKMLLDQIPLYGDASRLRMNVYPGGHMQYLREDSRKALREDAKALIESK